MLNTLTRESSSLCIRADDVRFIFFFISDMRELLHFIDSKLKKKNNKEKKMSLSRCSLCCSTCRCEEKKINISLFYGAERKYLPNWESAALKMRICLMSANVFWIKLLMNWTISWRFSFCTPVENSKIKPFLDAPYIKCYQFALPITLFCMEVITDKVVGAQMWV